MKKHEKLTPSPLVKVGFPKSRRNRLFKLNKYYRVPAGYVKVVAFALPINGEHYYSIEYFNKVTDKAVREKIKESVLVKGVILEAEMDINL